MVNEIEIKLYNEQTAEDVRLAVYRILWNQISLTLWSIDDVVSNISSIKIQLASVKQKINFKFSGNLLKQVREFTAIVKEFVSS